LNPDPGSAALANPPGRDRAEPSAFRSPRLQSRDHANPKASRSTPTRLKAEGSAQPGLGEVKAADVLDGGECVSRTATVVQ
jgi:hypothetical protein